MTRYLFHAGMKDDNDVLTIYGYRDNYLHALMSCYCT